MPSFGQELLGSKPVVPDLPSLSLSAEQQKALAANIAAIPKSEQIATQVDLFNQQQIDKMLTNVIPNYRAITGNISGNIAALTAGQVPTDVQQQLQQSTAAASLAGGYGGTESGRNLYARDLGLTSLNLTEKGLASAESWMKTANSIYKPGEFNITSMFVSPAQMASFDVEERNAQFQRQWMKNQIAAQPAMWAQDLKEAVETAISIYSGSSAGVQHAGTMPVQGSSFGGYGGGVDSGTGSTGMIGSPSGPEGDMGGNINVNFSGNPNDPGSAAGGGAMDLGAGMGGGGDGLAGLLG